MRRFHVRLLTEDDEEWVTRFVQEHWGSRRIVRKGMVLYPDELEGFAAIQEAETVGLATYRIEAGECEIVTINSIIEGKGIGTSLLGAVRERAVSANCNRLWLVTTNDNLSALRFYQKRGLRLAALYPNALDKSRTLKPEIPTFGKDGIPLRDEIELDMPLNPAGPISREAHRPQTLG